MKKTIFLMCAIAMMMGTSCKKQQAGPVAGGETVTKEITLSPKICGIDTKSLTAASAEALVKTVDYYVFGEDELLDVSAHATSTDPVTVKLVTNSPVKYIYAIVNANSTIPTPKFRTDMFNYKTATMAKANGMDSFVMTGFLEVDLFSIEEYKLEIEVSRLISRVCIDKITNDMENSYSKLTVKDIYLINAADTYYYFNTNSCTGNFKNIAKKDASTFAWLWDSVEKDITRGGNLQEKHIFYCYPNLMKSDNYSEDEKGMTGYTRLVVEVEIDDTTYFYPITINKLSEDEMMASNTSYNISNLTIKHLGVTHPNMELELDDVSVSVSVKEWDVMAVGEITL